ncbi:heterogeneous nuclear ribonucleoprotein L-like [Artemia franciscana]|uniref:RRM domain-containing protein n=1 Tax=Artemia franciscana TaxID=6661 RepID=A0AA88LBB6_ARTSF|nr:hypothetical protein QYM36_002457 [Artemia franciscana]
MSQICETRKNIVTNNPEENNKAIEIRCLGAPEFDSVDKAYKVAEPFGEVLFIKLEDRDNKVCKVVFKNFEHAQNMFEKLNSDPKSSYKVEYSLEPLSTKLRNCVFSFWNFELDPVLPAHALFVQNLDDRINCDNIFGLFCVYGIVDKIKIVKNGVQVQMADQKGAERVKKYFNGLSLLGRAMSIRTLDGIFVKKDEPPQISRGGHLPLEIYNSSSESWRSQIADQPPRKELYFYNTPKSLTESDIRDLFKKANIPDPVQVDVLYNDHYRNSKGIVKMNSIEDAVQAIAFRNNSFETLGNNPEIRFIFKLTFYKD